MCRLSLCLALLMLPVIGSAARAQTEAVKKTPEPERDKKTQPRVTPKSKATSESEAAKEAEQAQDRFQHESEAASESEAAKPAREMSPFGEGKPIEPPTPKKSALRERANTEQGNQAQGERVIAENHEHGHGHHSDAGCDSYKDLNAKKKCEEQKQKARPLKHNDPK